MSNKNETPKGKTAQSAQLTSATSATSAKKTINVLFAPTFRASMRQYVDYKASQGNDRESVKGIIRSYVRDFHDQVSENPHIYPPVPELYDYSANNVKHALFETKNTSFKTRIIFKVVENKSTNTITVRVYVLLDQRQSVVKQLSDYSLYNLF